MVKANAYGHGSVPLSKYLQRHGFRHFAVASAQEGEELRQAGITGNIHVLGEPRRDKTIKMSVRPAKTQISLGIRTASDQSLRCALRPKVSSCGQRKL